LTREARLDNTALDLRLDVRNRHRRAATGCANGSTAAAAARALSWPSRRRVKFWRCLAAMESVLVDSAEASRCPDMQARRSPATPLD
jgi:hypothetical protein